MWKIALKPQTIAYWDRKKILNHKQQIGKVNPEKGWDGSKLVFEIKKLVPAMASNHDICGRQIEHIIKTPSKGSKVSLSKT